MVVDQSEFLSVCNLYHFVNGDGSMECLDAAILCAQFVMEGHNVYGALTKAKESFSLDHLLLDLHRKMLGQAWPGVKALALLQKEDRENKAQKKKEVSKSRALTDANINKKYEEKVAEEEG
jgi:hypothetical protein